MSMIVSHAAAAPETYWKSVLPNAPMPKSLTQLLNNDKSMDILAKDTTKVGRRGSTNPFYYLYAATDDQLQDDPNLTLFFLENDLQRGKEMNLHFTKTTGPSSTFLPRRVADTITFSSKKLPELYARLAIKPDMVESQSMKQTISECEDKGMEGEEKYCATSLEAMLDFSTSKLGNEVKAISTEVKYTREMTTPLHKYTIKGVKKLADRAVVCHKLNYPYAVFYCHKTDTTALVYAVSLVGEDSTKAKAVAICHTDTTKWNPKHLAFRVLKVKPGTTSVCHFLPEDHIVWVPNYVYPHGFYRVFK
ncbi:hypothetical protein OSB04_010494 [Centaurea solstitialis]|uniref:BURP domain-containing protein n=1 Tax=Centaurea solstitialis TaxID=347529 RepID=A0AA38TJG3_9ASTR|nr:hypothetical protein OSB04_010494 [Centaurea solstitialis]